LEDDAVYIEADIEFHRAVAEAARNGLMADYLYIARQMLGSAIPQVVGVPGIKQSGLEMQQRILEAIRDGDAQAARQYALENVTSWSDVYLNASENADGA
jgi:DNA-binding FadR family transcriptional regulator